MHSCSSMHSSLILRMFFGGWDNSLGTLCTCSLGDGITALAHCAHMRGKNSVKYSILCTAKYTMPHIQEINNFPVNSYHYLGLSIKIQSHFQYGVSWPGHVFEGMIHICQQWCL